MDQIKLYPLKFEPIYQYRIWGGRRLSDLLTKPLPENDLVGEAWILSDRDDHPSKVINGNLQGKTINELFALAPEELMGKFSDKFKRFPLLLKFLDCKQVLSVQVHPADGLKEYIPEGESGKTEAWVVLETGQESIIYAGLKPGTNEVQLRESLNKNQVADDLSSFKPNIGDIVLIKAGTVHTLGDVVVFEVQENSDVTYRLYDWGRVDEKTGRPRDLQVEQAIACIDFTKTAIGAIKPVIEYEEPIVKEKLIKNDHFNLFRLTGTLPFTVGKNKSPVVLVCIEGEGEFFSDGKNYTLGKGEVMLLPAIIGKGTFVPKGKIIVLELALPEN